MTEQIFTGFAPPTSNFSPLPHQLIEAFPLFETKAEVLLVLYILRHTWGFHDDDKRITVDEFMHGRKRKDGTRIDNGTGMSKPAIIEGLRRAEEHGFITVESNDRDKARVKKFYRLNEGSRNFTPEVKELYPGGKETLQRSEKETSEENFQKKTSIVPNGTDGDSKPPKKRKKKAEPKPRKEVEPELLYEAVELHIFGIAPDENAPYDWNGRCGVIVRWLNGQVSRFRDHEFGRISSPAQPEHVKRFADDYRQNNERASLPKDPVKFVENWRKWASSLKAATPKSQSAARTTPTPEEQAAAAQRVALRRERLAATLAQDNPT